MISKTSIKIEKYSKNSPGTPLAIFVHIFDILKILLLNLSGNFSFKYRKLTALKKFYLFQKGQFFFVGFLDEQKPQAQKTIVLGWGE